jgi:hypothetical protein
MVFKLTERDLERQPRDLEHMTTFRGLVDISWGTDRGPASKSNGGDLLGLSRRFEKGHEVEGG